MAPKGKKGANGRFYKKLLFWMAMNNIGMKILIKEGYEISKAIGGGKGEKWPIEIYWYGVCELPKPTGTHKKSTYEIISGVDRMFLNPHLCIHDRITKITKKTIFLCYFWTPGWPLGSKNTIFGSKRAILGHRCHKMARHAAERARIRKAKVSRVTSGHGEIMIPSSQVCLRPTSSQAPRCASWKA